MNLTLNDAEIKKALTNFIATEGINIDHKKVTVTLIAGRGEKGHSAEIAISEMTTQTADVSKVDIAPVAESTGKSFDSDGSTAETETDDSEENKSLFK